MTDTDFHGILAMQGKSQRLHLHFAACSTKSFIVSNSTHIKLSSSYVFPAYSGRWKYVNPLREKTHFARNTLK